MQLDPQHDIEWYAIFHFTDPGLNQMSVWIDLSKLPISTRSKAMFSMVTSTSDLCKPITLPTEEDFQH